MDVYWINCLLACALAYILGHTNAERKFKKMLANMLYGKGMVVGQAPSNGTGNDK